MSKGRKIGSTVLIIILAVVAALCFLYCINNYIEHQDALSEYQDIEDEFVETDEDTGLLDIDWDRLLTPGSGDVSWDYPEVVAWLYLNEDTSYPVVQHTDNSYYLSRSASQGYSSSGAIFMSYSNTPDFSDRNTVIYGHNMNNGSMFGSNKRYRDEEFTREHPYFYIYTPDGKCRLYEIYAVMEINDATMAYDTSITTDTEFTEFIQDTAPQRLFDLGVRVTSKDSVVTLSTCAKHNTLRRLVIQGVYRGEITQLPGIAEDEPGQAEEGFD